jgi:hypothetical protein
MDTFLDVAAVRLLFVARHVSSSHGRNLVPDVSGAYMA